MAFFPTPSLDTIKYFVVICLLANVTSYYPSDTTELTPGQADYKLDQGQSHATSRCPPLWDGERDISLDIRWRESISASRKILLHKKLDRTDYKFKLIK